MHSIIEGAVLRQRRGGEESPRDHMVSVIERFQLSLVSRRDVDFALLKRNEDH